VGEAAVRCELGTMAYEQGGIAEAHTCFDASVRMHRMLRYRAGERRALHGLGLLLDEGLGRHTEADDYVAQDLRIAQELGDRQGEGRALVGHGRHALAGLGLLTQATVVYQRALELDRTLGYRHLAVETTADLARVALAQGDVEWATTYVATILDHLKEHGAAGTEEPVLLYLTCCQ